MKRYRLIIEYEDLLEWGIGVVPGSEAGETVTGPMLAHVLRKVADQVERRFPGDAVDVAYPIPEDRA